MREKIGYTIGVILGNVESVLSEEDFMESIEILMGDKVDYSNNDIVKGYASTFNVDEFVARKQLLQLEKGERTIKEINIETYVESLEVDKNE